MFSGNEPKMRIYGAIKLNKKCSEEQCLPECRAL